MSTTTTANVDLCVRALIELFGAGRLEVADELITPDCVDHGGDSGPPVRGRDPGTGPEAIKWVVRWLRGAFPDLASSRSTSSASRTAGSPSTGHAATTPECCASSASPADAAQHPAHARGPRRIAAARAPSKIQQKEIPCRNVQ